MSIIEDKNDKKFVFMVSIFQFFLNFSLGIVPMGILFAAPILFLAIFFQDYSPYGFVGEFLVALGFGFVKNGIFSFLTYRGLLSFLFFMVVIFIINKYAGFRFEISEKKKILLSLGFLTFLWIMVFFFDIALRVQGIPVYMIVFLYCGSIFFFISWYFVNKIIKHISLMLDKLKEASKNNSTIII